MRKSCKHDYLLDKYESIVWCKLQDSCASIEWKPCILWNLKVFNALAFTHVKNDKLEAQNERCIFIGYIVGAKV